LTIIDLRKRTTMKIKSLHIADFNQFQNFSLDLTYPEGHERAGEPLDKVCIIGQSGTGKTSLLRFMQRMTKIEQELVDNEYVWTIKDISNLKYGNKSFISINVYDHVANKLAFIWHWTVDERSNNSIHNAVDTKSNYHEQDPSNIFVQNYQKSLIIPAELVQRYSEFEEKVDKDLTPPQFLDLGKIHLGKFWKSYQKQISDYQKKLIQKRNEFGKLVANKSVTAKQLSIEADSLREFEEQLENPLTIIGNGFLNKLLENFKLRVKTDVDLDDIGFLKIEDFQGREVPNAFLSTGTKQILLTALPIYASKLKNALIFFDEPERSLYPDIQTKIVDFYTSLAPDSQFFFATHSPLVASSFDPWEIVELKFKEDGAVYQELYYEGERHVDNYNVFPKRLDYSGILSKVFDVEEESNAERIKALMELSLLERKIKETPLQSEKKILWKQYEKLANSLNWETADA
jgi:ABC-type lipoprotein export system ATPase subunit